jgi:PAS domain S-box-containing protein
MKIFSYKLFKKKDVDTLQHKLVVHEKDIAGATEFVKAIEQGNLDVRYNGNDQVDEGNTLATSLISMRDQMKKFQQEERQRNWVTEGLAKFADILRAKSDNIEHLTDDIISNLVKYMDANQGALYIINDDDDADTFLEMKACYAYERKKHLNKRIPLGEGITGQVVLEKSTNYMRSIPADFVKITSGLGSALPRHLLVTPLKLEEQVLGVIEIASFQEIKNYQIEFVEKLGESIASTISAVKVNDRTRKLLNETQAQAEQMRSQEEEMRQNMEELSATQEEMHRVLTEVQGKERYMIDLINASTDSILTIGRDYKVINCNTIFKKTYSGSGMEIDKGFDIMQLMATAEEKTKNKALYEKVFNGESFELTEQIPVNGQTSYFVISYSPLRNDQGEVIAVAIFVKDITTVTKAKNDAQQQAEDVKAQEEELRQNMEELSTTQEEMQRILTEVQGKERYMTDLINASTDSILTVGRDYRIVNCNSVFQETYSASGMEIGKGFNIMQLMNTDEEREKNVAYYDRVFNGESFELTDQYTLNGQISHFIVSYSPLRNEHGEVIAVAIFVKDITAVTKARNEAQQQAEEVKAQEEELRQNMEELSATQEEMHRILTEVQAKEQYMNALIDSSKDAILTIDRDYRIVAGNANFKAMFAGSGLNVDKGTDIMVLMNTEEEKAMNIGYYKRAFAGESFETTQHVVVQGHPMYMTISYNPIRNEKGEITSIAIFTKDVTQVTMARQDAEQKEKYLDEILNSATDSIFTLDRDFKVISFNKAFSAGLEAMGIPVQKGFDLMSLFQDPEENKKQRAIYQRAFKGEHFELTSEYNMNGVVSHFVNTHSPLRNEKGEVFAIACFAKDVTERINLQKQTENLLTQSQKQATELKAALKNQR